MTERTHDTLVTAPPVSDEASSTPMQGEPMPRPPGPITLSGREFFDSGIEANDGSGVFKHSPFITPRVPLRMPTTPPNARKMDRVEFSGGIMVIKSTSTAWIGTGMAVTIGAVLSLVLYLEAAAAHDAIAKKDAELTALTAQLAEALSLPVTTAPAAALAPAPEPPKAKAAVAPAVVEAATPAPSRGVDGTRTRKVVDALTAQLKEELARGAAKIVVEGPRVKLVVAGPLMFTRGNRITRSGSEVLGRVGGVLAPMPYRIDVIAHTDGGGRVRSSDFGQSAAAAAAIVRAFADHAGIEPKRMSVVGRGSAEPARDPAESHRLELVVSTRAPE